MLIKNILSPKGMHSWRFLQLHAPETHLPTIKERALQSREEKVRMTLRRDQGNDNVVYRACDANSAYLIDLRSRKSRSRSASPTRARSRSRDRNGGSVEGGRGRGKSQERPEKQTSTMTTSMVGGRSRPDNRVSKSPWRVSRERENGGNGRAGGGNGGKY